MTQINKVRTPGPEGTPRDDILRLDYDRDSSDHSDDPEVELSRTQSMTTKAATLQTDMTNFVSVEKPSFEETVVSMLKKLDNKIDNLKESRSTTASNSENHYIFKIDRSALLPTFRGKKAMKLNSSKLLYIFSLLTVYFSNRARQLIVANEIKGMLQLEYLLMIKRVSNSIFITCSTEEA